MLLRISICIIILLNFSHLYADENLKIQKTFNNIAKHIKTDKRYEDDGIVEKKSSKFNIKIAQNSDKNFDIHSTLRKAKGYFESGNSETAISLLNQITTKFPYHKNALIGLGNIYYTNKEYKKATDIYVRLLKEYPDNSYILENFLIIVSQYDHDLALEKMLKLYDTHKNHAPLLANLGLIYMKQKNFVKAKEYMVTAVSLDQNNVFYTYNLAIILDRLSDLKNAAALYTKLLNISTALKSVGRKIPVHKVEARLKFIKLHSARSTAS